MFRINPKDEGFTKLLMEELVSRQPISLFITSLEADLISTTIKYVHIGHHHLEIMSGLPELVQYKIPLIRFCLLFHFTT